jgi:type II secretory pathway pseudopilin PulG
VTIALLGLIAAGMLVLISATAGNNRRLHATQRCLAAAQAQLDSLAATGAPLADADVARLWPGVRVTADESAGEGDWASLRLLSVTAATEIDSRPVRVTLRRYVSPAEVPR